jgi:ABC-2 type transport system ATP-binding protein/lipopolysaccharide transport system ATP-binding protein
LRPDVLLLDEGLGTADAEFTARANRRLDEFMTSAGILVLASHGDALLKEQCTEAVWLQAGAIVEQGDVDDVLRGYRQSYSTEING